MNRKCWQASGCLEKWPGAAAADPSPLTVRQFTNPGGFGVTACDVCQMHGHVREPICFMNHGLGWQNMGQSDGSCYITSVRYVYIWQREWAWEETCVLVWERGIYSHMLGCGNTDMSASIMGHASEKISSALYEHESLRRLLPLKNWNTTHHAGVLCKSNRVEQLKLVISVLRMHYPKWWGQFLR